MRSINDLPCEILMQILDLVLNTYAGGHWRADTIVVLTETCRAWHSILSCREYTRSMVLGNRKYVRPELTFLTTSQAFLQRITQLDLYVHNTFPRSPGFQYYKGRHAPKKTLVDQKRDRKIELAKLDEMAKLVIASNDAWKEYRNHQRWLDERRQECSAFDYRSEFLLILLNSPRLKTLTIGRYFCDNAQWHGQCIRDDIDDFKLSHAIEFLPQALWQSGGCAQIKRLELRCANVETVQDVKHFQGMSIEELYLESCTMSFTCLQSLLRCFSRLQRLTIRYCDFPIKKPKKQGIKQRPAVVNFFAAIGHCCPSLRHLVIDRLSGQVKLGNLSHFEKLETLEISHELLVPEGESQDLLCSLLPAACLRQLRLIRDYEMAGETVQSFYAALRMLKENIPNLNIVHLV